MHAVDEQYLELFFVQSAQVAIYCPMMVNLTNVIPAGQDNFFVTEKLLESLIICILMPDIMI